MAVRNGGFFYAKIMSDNLRKYKSLYSSTTNTFSTGEAVTITPASVVGLPTDTEIVLTFDRLDSSGIKTPAKMERIKGTIIGGNFVISTGGRAIEGTEQTHTSPVVEMIWNAADWNDHITHHLVQHNQDGTHKGTMISGAAEKTTPVDADVVPISDSEASNVLKKLSWANIKATLKTYFDSVTTTLSNKTLASPLFTGAVSGWISLGACTYEGADAPTFTISFASDMTGVLSPGMRIKLTDSTVKYFIITAVGAFSGGKTIITIYGGTDYTLSGGAITLPYYSTQKAPQGFPLDKSKWTVQVNDTTSRTQSSPVNGTWYNLGGFNIPVPIGCWDLSYFVTALGDKTNPAEPAIRVTLSTANNSQSDSEFSCFATLQSVSQTFRNYVSWHFTRNKIINITTKTPYYLNTMADGVLAQIMNQNATVPAIIRAVCAYL